MNVNLLKDVLNARNKELHQLFLDACGEVEGIDVSVVAEMSDILARKYMRRKLSSEEEKRVERYENRWYDSLEAGKPDYGVYGEDSYLSETWACWRIYSRGYLKGINHQKSLDNKSIVDDLSAVKTVIDVGCGIGFTTAGLKQLFPNADVVGTNIEGSKQISIARIMGRGVGVSIVDSIDGLRKGGLVFASEYFEHFEEPLTHLEEILELEPVAMIVANAFSGRSVGHFPTYKLKTVGGLGLSSPAVPGRMAQREFNKTMRLHGYEPVSTRLSNNRPAYWRKAG